jgi:hypothetical protein
MLAGNSCGYERHDFIMSVESIEKISVHEQYFIFCV